MELVKIEWLQLESILVAVQGTVIEEVVMVLLPMTKGSHFEAYNLNAKRFWKGVSKPAYCILHIQHIVYSIFLL